MSAAETAPAATTTESVAGAAGVPATTATCHHQQQNIMTARLQVKRNGSGQAQKHYYRGNQIIGEQDLN